MYPVFLFMYQYQEELAVIAMLGRYLYFLAKRFKLEPLPGPVSLTAD
jgi:hypothetical protein